MAMITPKTFSLCGVYCCKGLHKYPTLLRIDYEEIQALIEWQTRGTPTHNLKFYFSNKFEKYNKAWLEHLNIYPNEPKN